MGKSPKKFTMANVSCRHISEERMKFVHYNMLFLRDQFMIKGKMNVFIEDAYMLDGAKGVCEYSKKSGQIDISFKALYVKQTDKRELADTMIHEIMHSSQYETGRMIDVTGTNITIFDGKEYNRKGMSYDAYPWEIEANLVSENTRLLELILS